MIMSIAAGPGSIEIRHHSKLVGMVVKKTVGEHGTSL